MIWQNILSVIFFIFGLFIKRENLGKNLLKINFYFLLPILIFKIFSTIKFNPSLIYISFIALIIILLTMIIGVNLFKNEINQDKGVLIIAPMIMNISAVYPFVFINFSEKYLQNVAFFDLANGILTLSLTYSIAIKFGSKTGKINFKKIISPPLVAIFAGIVFSLLNIKFNFLEKIFPFIKYAIFFSIYFSLGNLFYFEKKYISKILKSNSIRFLSGLTIALISIKLFKIDLISSKILLLCATAPCGFNTLTFAVLENLNTKLASSIISTSLLFYFPIAFIIIMI